ncbi:MAG TPA: hypothetical protein VJS64_17465 [Pyrinomonadaceae bacterium]|nr:hypothetical protein [Pyrinomonadaceae bacterium]
MDSSTVLTAHVSSTASYPCPAPDARGPRTPLPFERQDHAGTLLATGGVWLLVVITDRSPKEPRFDLKVQPRAVRHEVTTPRLRLFRGRSLSKT